MSQTQLSGSDSLEWISQAEIHILESVLATDPVPLDQVCDGGGVYLLLYGGTDSTYKSIADGSRPIYIGQTLELAQRLTQHATSLTEAANLRASDFWVVAQPLPIDGGAAVMAERTLQAMFCPVWNDPQFTGFGSRPQGAGRTSHQPPTVWDRIHPGRQWALPQLPENPTPDRSLRRAARQFVRSQPTLPTWRLPTCDPSSNVDPDVLIPLSPTNDRYTLALSSNGIHVVIASQTLGHKSQKAA